jgi:hypothetical protein
MLRAPLDFYRDNVKRYRQLIRGERPDWAPYRLWLDNTFCCEYAGVDPARYAADFELMFEAQRVVNERFYDLRDFCVEVDTADLFFDREQFETDHPHAVRNRFLANSLDDFDRYFCRRKIAEVPSVRRLKEGIAYFNKRLPAHKQVCHYLGVFGLMDLFSILRGTEHFFLDLYDHPAKVKRIFDALFERILEWLEFEERTWGGPHPDNILFDKIDIGEDYAAYLPPDLFDEFVRPYTGEIFARYKGKAWCSLHTDGDMLPQAIHKLAELNIDELMGFSPNYDIKVFREALPDVVLGGNIHPIKVMNEGSPEDVKKAVGYCFSVAGTQGRFVLCTGGAIGAGAKPENIDALLEAAYEITRYA